MRATLEDHLLAGTAPDIPDHINAKDRHIVGAALNGEAAFVVTNDRRLRDEIEASPIAPRAVDLNDFAMELWDSSPAELRQVIDSLAAKRQRRPAATTEIVAALARHMPSLALALRT